MNGEKQLYNILKIFKIIRFFSHQSSNFGRRRRKRRKITFWKKKFSRWRWSVNWTGLNDGLTFYWQSLRRTFISISLSLCLYPISLSLSLSLFSLLLPLNVHLLWPFILSHPIHTLTITPQTLSLSLFAPQILRAQKIASPTNLFRFKNPAKKFEKSDRRHQLVVRDSDPTFGFIR